MKLSDIRDLNEYLGDDRATTIELLREISKGETDWTDFTSGVRVIAEHVIDSVMGDELECDMYCLGCFNADFIHDVTGIDYDVVDALQEAEAFEALGKLIAKSCDMSTFAYEYAAVDGYGHHFNSWDGSEHEITLNGTNYFVFKN